MSTYTPTGASQPIQLDENNNFIDPVTGKLMHQLTVEEMPRHTFGTMHRMTRLKKTENTCVTTNTSVMATTTACTAQWIVDNFSMAIGAVSLRMELEQKSSYGQNCQRRQLRRAKHDT